MMRLLLAFAGACFASILPVVSAPGDVDATYLAKLGANSVRAIAIQPDGRLLVGGGISSVDGVPRSGLVRLFPDGTADLAFDPGQSLNQIGIGLIDVDGIKILQDGRILASGWFSSNYAQPSPELIRFHPDGSYDPSFQMPPVGSAKAFTLLPDGKVLVAGDFWIGNVLQRLIRLNSDGSIDSSFRSIPNDFVNNVVVQDDGRVLVAGGFTSIGGVNQAGLARLLADGSVDAGFIPFIGGSVASIALQHDRSILAAVGTSTGNLIIRRFSESGALDSTFSASVSKNTGSRVNDIAVQADGRILLTGDFSTVNGAARNGVARLLSGGAIDNDLLVTNSNYFTDGRLVLQHDGRILLGGSFSYWGNNATSPPIRLQNGAGDSVLSAAAGMIQWQPAGTSPVIEKVNFEYRESANRPWVAFGSPTRTANGWTASTSGLPAAGTIRATGTTSSGRNSMALTRRMISFGGAQPVLELVDDSGVPLTNSSGVNLGNALAGYSKLTRFVIRNTGPGALLGIGFSFSGADASQFSIAETSPVPLGPGGELAFHVRFSPSGTGARTAVLSIESNSSSGPFSLILNGDGSNSLNPHFRKSTDVPIRTPDFDSAGKVFGNLSLGFAPPPGTVLTVIDQTYHSPDPMVFPDLPDGSVVTAAFNGIMYEFIAGYSGKAPFNQYPTDLTLTLIGPGCPRSDFSTLQGGDANVIAVSESGRMAFLNSAANNLRLTLADGTPLSFSPVFEKTGSWGYANRVLACPDKTLLVVGVFDRVNGSARNSLAKFDWNGNLIGDFLPDIGTETVNTVAVQNDGKILVSGGDTLNSVLRLNPDGSRDAGFSTTAIGSANLLAPLANGRILMAGQALDEVNGEPAGRLVRLNPDGSLDSTFRFTSEGPGSVGVVAEQADGRVVISDSAGNSNSRLRRILIDGSMDPGFEPDFGNNAGAHFSNVAIQTDGRILVAGSFSEVDGESRSFMVRLNPDGSLDPGFVSNGGTSNILVLGADGGILTNGSNTAGVAQNGLIKLRNNPGQITLEHPNPSTIRISSEGTAPLVRNSFAILPTGASEWIALPSPIRTPNGWSLTGLPLPSSGLIRSRSIPSNQGSSSSVIEKFIPFGSAVPAIALYSPSGSGIQPGGGFDFGPVLTGYTRQVKFRVTNHGDGFWDDFEVAFAGPDAGSFKLVSMPDYGLLPGESGIFEISASPVNAGSHTAVMVLSGNDPASNPLSITLTCQGGDIMSPTFANAEDVALRSGAFVAGGRRFGSLTLGFQPRRGTVLRLVDVTGSGAISGSFADLPDGGVVSSQWAGVTYRFVAGYVGGDGNDLVLSLLGPGGVDPYGPANLFDAYSGFLSFSVPSSEGSTLIGGNFTKIFGNAVSHFARILPDGSLDSTFKPNPNDSVMTVHRHEDGSLTFAGNFTAVGNQSRTRIARLRRDGSLDPAFTPVANNRIDVLKVQPDGRILIGGMFTSVNGVTRNRIARLLPDGSLDTAFNPNVNSNVRTIALQEDGRILIGGAFTTVGGTSRPRIARLGSDGVLDSGFVPVFTYGTGSTFEVRSVHVQSDGAVLIGSSFRKVNDVTSEYICRLLPSGQVDPAFRGGTDAMVTAIHQLAGGGILIGGGFSKVNGVSKSGVALLNPDGTLDDSFSSHVAAALVSQIAVHANGAIDIAGSMTSANGVARNGFVRLLNDSQADEFSAPVPGTVRWTRGGGCSNETAVAFERYDQDSGTWSLLAEARRASTAWEASSQTLPNPAVLRARTLVTNATATYQLNRPPGVIGTGPAALTIRRSDHSPLSPQGVGFGALPAGWKTARSLVLTNDGFSSLASISFDLTGAHSADFSIPQSPVGPLPPGGSARFEIRFSPGSEGPRQAQLTISSNDPGVEPLVILLSGDCGEAFSPVFRNAVDVPVSESSINVTGVAFGGLQLEFAPRPGTVLQALQQTGASAFSANLSGLPDRSDVTASFGGNIYHFTATYSGGDSNDLVFVLKSPGAADPEFMAGTNQTVTAIARPLDGSTILAGTFTECAGVPVTRIARLRPDGTADPSFRIALSSAPWSLNVQRDGRILVTATANSPDGTRRANLARIHSDGTLDSSFNPMVNGTVQSAIELRDGRILIGGNFTSVGGVAKVGLARLNADGSLDSGFTTTLTGTYRRVYALAEQDDGKLLVGGSFSGINGTNRGLLARLDSSGALDTGFDAGLALQGSNTIGVMNLLCQPDGRILVGGLLTSANYSPTSTLARLQSNGQRDPAFAPVLSSYPEAMFLQRDGGIVIGGMFTSVNDVPRNGMARLFPDGGLDLTFNPNPVRSTAAAVNCMAEDSEGRLLVGGAFKSMNGLGGANFSRLVSAAAATGPEIDGISRVEWNRSESFAELGEVQFDLSTDSGVHWVPLGSATRHATGWELDGVSLPASGHLRVTGRQLAGKPGSAVVRLASLFGRPPTSIESWRENWFANALNEGAGASAADADMDGLPNLLEFALGLNPLNGNSNQVPGWHRVGSAYELHFERPSGVSGIDYMGEWSESLTSGRWHPAVVLSEGSTLRFQVPMEDKARLFFRLRVTEP